MGDVWVAVGREMTEGDDGGYRPFSFCRGPPVGTCGALSHAPQSSYTLTQSEQDRENTTVYMYEDTPYM